jgi:hypothetical protein
MNSTSSHWAPRACTPAIANSATAAVIRLPQILAHAATYTAHTADEPLIWLLPFAVVGFESLPRSLSHHSIHKHARSSGSLLNLAA